MSLPFIEAEPPAASKCNAARCILPATVLGEAFVVSLVQPAAACAIGAAIKTSE
jgi:hypothetical protein